MEIKIRNLSQKAVVGLSDMAAMKGVSREKFVRNLLENYVSNQNVTGEVQDLTELTKHNLQVLQKNTAALQSVYEVLQNIKE